MSISICAQLRRGSQLASFCGATPWNRRFSPLCNEAIYAVSNHTVIDVACALDVLGHPRMKLEICMLDLVLILIFL
jgi:hypothetical protein